MTVRHLISFLFGLMAVQAFSLAATPDGTYLYAKRDTCDLFLDIYEPARGSVTKIDGKDKPTIIFMFGGGFAEGERDCPRYGEWFSAMTANGYRIVSIDYRLGLKRIQKVGIAQAKLLDCAIHLAVEDLFSATSFLIQNAETLDIDPDNIIISGSSAGAVAAMQAEYEICNRTVWTEQLPDGFNYAGVMSFSGAIFSRQGELRYASAPCPMLIFHGTADKIVPYKQIKVGRLGFFGGGKIATKLRKSGYGYVMYHFKGLGHEVAEFMARTLGQQSEFILEDVMQGRMRTLDVTLED
ncbi:MAG: carboxylesterase family protein [Candidatus Cryptobacteroides sp.]